MSDTLAVQYTGTEPCSQPGLSLSWQPGDSKELPIDLANLFLRDPEGPFTRVALKVARAQAADETPATDTPAQETTPSASAAEGTA